MLAALESRLALYAHNVAVATSSGTTTYAALAQKRDFWLSWLELEQIPTSSVVLLNADFSPNAIALLLALYAKRMIVALTTGQPENKIVEFAKIAAANVILSQEPSDTFSIRRVCDEEATHPLLVELKVSGESGLVIFSSGSSGNSKAAVHRVAPLMKKVSQASRCLKVLAFLLFDHIGGQNTLFYTLFNGGTVVIPDNRSPSAVAAAIDSNKAAALTTTPTFLRLMLMSQAHQQYDLSSLEVINYGTEVMPMSTLAELRRAFPKARLSQAYGLSESGVLPVRSRDSNSLFMKVDDVEYKTRIVDGLLEIKSPSAMLGYLNAPSPFTADGWLKTGDRVEVDGEYLRILGRASEMINVGGQKVYPAEVENALLQLSGVSEVVVRGEANPIVGQAVHAAVLLSTGESAPTFARRMRQELRTRLPTFMIPQRVTLLEGPVHGIRFKKMRLEKERVKA